MISSINCARKYQGNSALNKSKYQVRLTGTAQRDLSSVMERSVTGLRYDALINQAEGSR